MRLATVLFLALSGSLFAQNGGVIRPVAEHKQPRFTFKIKELNPSLPRGKQRWFFITTPLTRDFAKLPFASHRIDAKTRRLHLRRFYGVQESEYIYRITPEGLEFESKKLVE